MSSQVIQRMLGRSAAMATADKVTMMKSRSFMGGDRVQSTGLMLRERDSPALRWSVRPLKY